MRGSMLQIDQSVINSILVQLECKAQSQTCKCQSDQNDCHLSSEWLSIVPADGVPRPAALTLTQGLKNRILIIYSTSRPPVLIIMGSFTSKAAKTTAGAARRQYPQRVPPPPTSNAPPVPSSSPGQPTAPGRKVHPQSQASGTKDESMRTSCLTAVEYIWTL